MVAVLCDCFTTCLRRSRTRRVTCSVSMPQLHIFSCRGSGLRWANEDQTRSLFCIGTDKLQSSQSVRTRRSPCVCICHVYAVHVHDLCSTTSTNAGSISPQVRSQESDCVRGSCYTVPSNKFNIICPHILAPLPARYHEQSWTTRCCYVFVLFLLVFQILQSCRV